MYEHPAFPDELHRKIETWVFENAADERKPEQTDQQFVYSTRKKAIGPFKRELWDLAAKDEILAAQRRKFSFLFTELGVNGSREMINAYIRPVEVHRPMPESLREAVTAG
jgi:fructose-bisphosphate aldolase class II